MNLVYFNSPIKMKYVFFGQPTEDEIILYLGDKPTSLINNIELKRELLDRANKRTIPDTFETSFFKQERYQLVENFKFEFRPRLKEKNMNVNNSIDKSSNIKKKPIDTVEKLMNISDNMVENEHTTSLINSNVESQNDLNVINVNQDENSDEEIILNRKKCRGVVRYRKGDKEKKYKWCLEKLTRRNTSINSGYKLLDIEYKSKTLFHRHSMLQSKNVELGKGKGMINFINNPNPSIHNTDIVKPIIKSSKPVNYKYPKDRIKVIIEKIRYIPESKSNNSFVFQSKLWSQK
ncbi:hypothetical protein TCON_1885 [Astathelohania contejeani]|uniref:Uncharacterized protein n=1 Tax=Astathelohania contejeani TaxID=164912 RepID=A0ABQ7HXJ4_9MICR|nr:hypothetical protein TCON_1885 [Thelohania contejeani]